MVRKTTAFWDSSALVPLCIHEITSRQAQSYLRRLLPVVWWVVHSAISRLHRLGKLKDADKKGALARLEMMSRGGEKFFLVINYAALQRACWTFTNYERLTACNLPPP